MLRLSPRVLQLSAVFARKPWLRPLPFALFAGLSLSRISRVPIDDTAPNRSTALCTALARTFDVLCQPGDVSWVNEPKGLSTTIKSARALVRAHEREKGDHSDASDAFDLFLVTVRISPEGHLLDVNDVHNVTHTSGADEGVPVLQGTRAAYVVLLDGHPEAVHVMDLAGHDPQAYEELTRFQRTQVKVADLQQTSQWRGVKRTVYALVPPPARADLVFRDDGTLEVRTDARTLLVDPAHDAVIDGTAYLRVTPEIIAKPPTFAPWMSDRLRAASWFGDEKNQIVKALTFTAIEWLKHVRAKVTGDTGEKDAQEDLGSLNQQTSASPPETFADPEIGWPPKPLDPLIKPPLAGEGKWISLEKDAFITPIPSVPAPFCTTFVRTDPNASNTRVYITLWDPRLIALHMEAGTVEPVSATGEAGPGQIPRMPEIMGHLVAGFNGGFQATHGEFGMQASGVLYLPPKPYGATVLELRDGTTAFGAWPRSADVPDEVLSFRQNLTPLVQNDKYNPWGRAWWGGVPPGWHDAIHTTRSGLCLTKERFVAYFWGNDIGPEPLGRAMLLARCAFGIHLDMNPGLAGFEFYNVQNANTFQPLGRPLQADWEYEGNLKDLPDFKFRSRRMIKSMGHMLFPRYIHRDARDFFYLTARTVLPGPALSTSSPQVEGGADGEDGRWRVRGLPQHGYPYAIATTNVALTPGGRRVRVLRIDPRTVRAERGPRTDTAEGNAPLVAVFGTEARHVKHEAPNQRRREHAQLDSGVGNNDRTLWLGPHVFVIEKTGPQNATAIAEVTSSAAEGASSRAAVGISDEDGMLQWVELLPEDSANVETATQMLMFLKTLGCSSRGLVLGDLRVGLGGTTDVGGAPLRFSESEDRVRLVRTPAPGAREYFESNEIVPQSVWHPLQSQRVKWRPTLAPREKPATPGSASASSSAPSPP